MRTGDKGLQVERVKVNEDHLRIRKNKRPILGYFLGGEGSEDALLSSQSLYVYLDLFWTPVNLKESYVITLVRGPLVRPFVCGPSLNISDTFH